MLNTTEAGQKFVVEEMSFIPYNADPATTSAGYSLGDSIISYMAADKTLLNIFFSPLIRCDNVPKWRK